MEELSKSERLEEGQLYVRVILEMLGAPKDHIEKTMLDYVQKLKEDKDLKIVKEYYSEAKAEEKHEGKLFSLYSELEIWFKDVEKVMAFCIDSLPSSVEILEPSECRFKSNRLSGLLNDLQANLHKLDAAFKKHITDQQAAAKNFTTIIDNFIRYCLKNDKMTAGEIAKIVGLEKDRAEKWLNKMVEKKIIHKKDNIYSL